jgi:hypothetical protein
MKHSLYWLAAKLVKKVIPPHYQHYIYMIDPDTDTVEIPALSSILITNLSGKQKRVYVSGTSISCVYDWRSENSVVFKDQLNGEGQSIYMAPRDEIVITKLTSGTITITN